MGRVSGRDEKGGLRRGPHAGPGLHDEFEADATVGLNDLVADGFVSVPGAAQFLGISRSKTYESMDAGELMYAKFGRARRIPQRALREFAAARLRGGWRGEVS